MYDSKKEEFIEKVVNKVKAKYQDSQFSDEELKQLVRSEFDSFYNENVSSKLGNRILDLNNADDNLLFRQTDRGIMKSAGEIKLDLKEDIVGLEKDKAKARNYDKLLMEFNTKIILMTEITESSSKIIRMANVAPTVAQQAAVEATPEQTESRRGSIFSKKTRADSVSKATRGGTESAPVSPIGSPPITPTVTRKAEEPLAKSLFKSKVGEPQQPSSTASTQQRQSQSGWKRVTTPTGTPTESPRGSMAVPALDLKSALSDASKPETKTVDEMVDEIFASPRAGDSQPNTPEASPPPSPQQQRVRPTPPPKPDHLKSSASKSAASSQPSSPVVERKRPLPPPKPADKAPVSRQSTSPERKRTTNVGPENQPNVASLLGQSKNAGAPASDPTKSRASGSVKSAAPLPGAKTVAAFKDEAFLAKVRETVAKTDAGRKAPPTEGLAKK